MTAADVVRLSALDTVFLALDGRDSVGHLTLLIVVDGDLDVATLTSRVKAQVPRHALLRRRLATVPGGVGRPFWTEVAPDLDVHAGTSELPDGVGNRELAEVASSLSRDPLPRDRPLWRVGLLRSQSDRRSVVALTVHHAAADGLAIRELVSDLLDPLWEQEPELAVPAPPREALSEVRRWGGTLDLPAAVVGALPTAAGLVPGAVAGAAAAILTAPLTVRDRGRSDRRMLHGSVGADRSLAFGDVSLESARSLRATHGATVNDLVLAATAGALRRLLGELGEVPRHPLHAAVPASRREAGQSAADGANRFVVLRCPLPVHEPSREARVALVRAAMRAARERPDESEATMDALARFAVPALATPAVRTATRLGLARRVRLPYDLMVSNVPMPPVARTIAGLPVRAVRPVPLVTEGLGLNVTVHGYDNRLFYSVLSSPQVLAETERLVALIEDEHEQLAALAD